MERATHIDKDGWYINGAHVTTEFHSGTGETRMRGEEIDRLAAYEDTGLEPQEITRIVDEYGRGHTLRTHAAERMELIRDIPTDHLRELVEADRKGRCIIAPVKPGDVAWCGFSQNDPVSGTTKNVIYPVVLKGWWTGLKCAEYDPRHFRFGELYESEGAAKSALKGKHYDI